MDCVTRSRLMGFKAMSALAWAFPTPENKQAQPRIQLSRRIPRKSIMKSSSKFDIVVYGATGFTGRLVAEYLAAHYTGNGAPKWAMAGRSMDKLASVRDAIGAPADTALIEADASDPASLKAMVDQSSSVLSTVGPYQLYGSELVAICAATGTDYLDLCGEPVWMRQMIDSHEAEAQSTGARIVFSCASIRFRSNWVCSFVSRRRRTCSVPRSGVSKVAFAP